MSPIRSWTSLVALFERAAIWGQAPFLLSVRLFWGAQFALTGWGKITHLDRTAHYFQSLHLPWAWGSALGAGLTELVGGLLLLAGWQARLAALPLVVTMLVACVTADLEAVQSLWRDPEPFLRAEPFLFLFASLLILLFGPGRWSCDALFPARRSSS